jgi:hypothetical protein
MSVGTGKQTPGFADVFGGKLFNTIDYSGPTAYNNTGTAATSGDSLDPKMFGFNNTIESIIDSSLDQTGTYYAFEQPINNGVTAWRLRWFTAAGVEVANGVNLSGYTVKLSAVGF